MKLYKGGRGAVRRKGLTVLREMDKVECGASQPLSVSNSPLLTR